MNVNLATSKKNATVDPVKKYAIALRNPFDPRTEGVRTPDMYSFPVVPGHLRGIITGKANAIGYTALALLPNPVLSVVDLTHARTNGSSSAVGFSSMNVYLGNPQFAGATLPSSFNNIYNSYRMVAGGYKVTVQQPELTRTGMVLFAPFPCIRGVPGYNALQSLAISNADSAFANIIGGTAINNATSQSILGMPGAFSMSMADLGAKDVILPFRVLSAAAQDFKLTSASVSYNGTENYGDSFVALTPAETAQNPTADLEEVTNGVGWSGWYVYAFGYNDTVATDVMLNFEYMYHLEGTPVVISDSNSVITDAPAPPVVDTFSFNNIINAAAKLPWAEIVEAGASAFGVTNRGSHMIAY